MVDELTIKKLDDLLTDGNYGDSLTKKQKVDEVTAKMEWNAH